MNEELIECTRDAGVRPGNRGPFVSAKGPKAIDAPSDLTKFGGRRLWGGRANSLRSPMGRQFFEAPTKMAGRQASDNGKG